MSRILDEFTAAPWAIIPSHLVTIQTVLARHLAGVKLSSDEIALAVGSAPAEAAARRESAAATRGVSVIPVLGPLSQRSVQNVSGPGTTATTSLAQQFRTALADRASDSIVFDIDSPGGSVAGIQELASEIRAARGQKQIVAHANSLSASAAYWIATAADEIVATPSAMVGSIGVISAHEDVTELLAQQGRKVTLITAGENKANASPFQPLSDEARAEIQATVDAFYQDFLDAVADGRGVSTVDVEKRFGQGSMFTAGEALSRGMIDRIEAFDDTIARLRGGGQQSGFAARSREIDIESQAT